MYFEFREATRGELDACFRLRDASYFASPTLHGLLEISGESQRSGSHDDRSRHFRLFRQDDGTSQLVGYARVTEAFPESPKLPCLSYIPPHRAWRMEGMLRKLLDKYGMVVEGGRLAIQGGTHHRFVAKHAVESLTALYGLGFRAPAIAVISTHHQRFYETMGFVQVLPNERFSPTDTSNHVGVCMLLLPTTTPGTARLTAMLRCYARYGAIAYRPENRENFAPELVHPEALQSLTRLALREAA